MKFSKSRLLLAASALALLVYSGCPAKSNSGTGGAGTASAKVDANELVEAMRKIYREAQTYSDDGSLLWQAQDGPSWRDASVKLSTTYARPNRCDLQLRGLHMTCDGRLLRATVVEPALGNFDKQMLELPAPKKLELTTLLSDPTVASAITDSAVDSIPWPLRLLTDDAGLERLLAGSVKLLPDDALDDQPLHRVEVTQGSRRTVLWIEPQSHLLRRVELPDPDEVLGVRRAVADFRGAKVNGSIADEHFVRAVPPGTTRVQYFVAQPPAIKLPTELLGQAVGDFAFEKADGTLLSRDALAGQVVVLAWFDHHPASQQMLVQLQAAYEKCKANAKVRFFAVTPPVSLSSDQLQKTLAALKVTFPLLRDERAVGRERFHIAGAPTVIVLDGQHRLQEFIEGYQPQTDELLPQGIEELLAGGNPAGELRKLIAQDMSDFRRQLAAAKVGAKATIIELQPVEIAPPRAAEKLLVEKLWTCTEIKSPGNLLFVAGDESVPPMLLVIDHSDDWKTVVQLDAAGKIVARHKLALPPSAAISSLRTAVDAAGRRWYAGSSRLARQAFVLSDTWEVAAAYPAEDARHDGVGDFALVDFQGDGELQLCVGFWGALGTHGLSLTGERQWTNRVAAPVISLAISPPDAADRRQILAATDRGEIVPINGFGNNDDPRHIEHQAITTLVASQLGAGAKTIYMGLAAQADGSQIATALNAKLEPQWDVPLPAGAHRNQIQPVVSGRLLDTEVGQWLFTSADGTIGIVADDASYFDSLAIGQELHGIAVAQLGSQRVIVTSTAGEVTAWSVKTK